MAKTFTIRKTRTNASGITTVTVITDTLKGFIESQGVQASSIKSLINKVNKDYADRYACCYRLHCHLELVDMEAVKKESIN